MLDVRQNHLVFISGISGKLGSTFEGREITGLWRSDGCVPIRRGDQGVSDEPGADVHTYVNNVRARAAEANRRLLCSYLSWNGPSAQFPKKPKNTTYSGGPSSSELLTLTHHYHRTSCHPVQPFSSKRPPSPHFLHLLSPLALHSSEI